LVAVFDLSFLNLCIFFKINQSNGNYISKKFLQTNVRKIR